MKRKRNFAGVCLLVATTVAALQMPLIGQEMRPPMTFVVVIDVSGSMDDEFPAPIQPNLPDSTKLLDVKRRLSLLAQHLPDNTRVIVTKFDHQASQVCDIQLNSAQQRKKLREAFASIYSRNGSTLLWRTADQQLALAKKLAENHPEGRVRVLLYTDGDDMEKKPGLDHNTIIQKYGKTLQSVVALDWVTIGYDLKAEVKSALQEQGVNFTRADRPDDIVPMRAEFRLSANEILAGEELEVTDQSIGVDIVGRTVDWGDQSQSQNNTKLKHVYEFPGQYEICLTIRSASGKISTARDFVTVVAPDALTAKIAVSKLEVLVGEKVTVSDATDGVVAKRRFTYGIDGLSDAQSFDIRFDKAGDQKIHLSVIDRFGQKSTAFATVSVNLPPPPVAKIAGYLAVVQAGERFTLTDASVGEVAARKWVSGDKSYHGESLELEFDQPGTYTVSLEVADAHGQTSRANTEILVDAPPRPTADFRFSSSETSPGEKLTLINQSSDTAIRFQWMINGALASTERHPTVVVEKYGEIDVNLQAWDKFGQTHNVSRKLRVPLPAKPIARFAIPTSIEPGEELVIPSNSEGAIDGEPRWYFENKLVGMGQVLSFIPPASGTLKLEVSGPGGVSEISHRLNIKPYPKPTAGFTVGNPSPFIGDTIRITCTAGPAKLVHRVTYKISDRANSISFDATDLAKQPWFDLDCDSLGAKTIFQRVVGPGGEATASKTFAVSTRAQPPHVEFEASKTSARGPTEFIFKNLCRHVDRIEFDPGNGEPLQTYKGFENIRYTYQPGRSVQPTVTGYPAEGEPFTPAVWTGPLIKIAEPTPEWVQNLWWQILLGLTGLGFIALVVAKVRQRGELRNLSKIGGEVSVHPSGKPRLARIIPFEGLSNEESFDVGDDSVMKLSSSLQDQVIRYQLELQRAGNEPLTTEIEPDEVIKLGNYVVRYSA